MKTLILISILIATGHPLVGQTPVQLKVGDPAPTLNPLEWIKGPAVSDWENGRYYLVEFGSTWCGPCVKAIPHLTAMAKKYKSRLTVISVFVMEMNTAPKGSTPSYVESVKRYILERKDQIGYSVALDDADEPVRRAWLDAAGRVGIPHIFLIDEKGQIAWIGSNPEAAEQQLTNMLNKDKKLITKDAIQAIPNLKLKTENLVAEDTVMYSLLSLYRKNGPNMYHSRYIRSPFFSNTPRYGRVEIKVRGVALADLYVMAYGDTLWDQVYTRSMVSLQFPDTVKNPFAKSTYGKTWFRPLIETADTTLLWTRFNYKQVHGTEDVSALKLQQNLRHDLENQFSHHVTVEVRQMPCWMLVVKDPRKLRKLRSDDATLPFEVVDNRDGSYTFINATTRDIIWMLGSSYGYLDYDYGRMPKHLQAPFIDKTGLDFPIRFTFSKEYSFNYFLEYLNSMGLDVVRSKKPMRVVVIRDADE